MTSLKEQIARYKDAPEKEPRVATRIWFELPVSSSHSFELVHLMSLNNALRGESTEEERLSMCHEALAVWCRNNALLEKHEGEQIFGGYHGIYGGEVLGLRSTDGEALEIYHGIPSRVNGSGRGPIGCPKRLCVIRGTSEDIRRYEAAIFGGQRLAIPLPGYAYAELAPALILKTDFCKIPEDRVGEKSADFQTS